MKRLIYITIFVFTLLIGIVSTQMVGIVDISTEQVNDYQIQPLNAPEIVNPRFQLLQRDFNGFNFQSSDGKRRFTYGCNGCGKEIGDISILHNFVGSESMREIFEANCTKKRKGQSIKRNFKLDESGRRISERCVIVERSGETRIIWNESETEYWTIDATSLNLAEEFESSETFHLVKSESVHNENDLLKNAINNN